MKYVLLFVSIGIFSCTKNTLPIKIFPETLPVCIQQQIDTFKSKPVGNPPQSIIEYSYRNKRVFYIPPQCCDQYSEVFDDNYNLIGHPDGGITGKGDGLPVNFFEDVKDAKVIWKDDR